MIAVVLPQSLTFYSDSSFGLVIAIDKWIRSKNPKMDSMIFLLGFIDLIYFLFLVSVNVMLDKQNPNITGTQLAIKTLICLVPLMAGGIYGYYRILHKDKIAKADAEKLAETIRQEKRADKQQIRLVKAGVMPNAVYQQTAAPIHERATREAGDFRDYVMELLDQTNGQMPLTEITATGNKNKRVQFIHANGTGSSANPLAVPSENFSVILFILCCGLCPVD